MRVRLAAVTAAAALAVVAVPGHAAVAPQITDPSGDALLPLAGLDIVSALFATKGRTQKVSGKTVYVPKSLEVTVTYAAAPDKSPVSTQAVLFDLTGCGMIYLQRYNGDATWATAECVADPIDYVLTTKGNTLTFSLPFSAIGKQFKKGSVLTDLRTWTGVADPVLGYGPAEFIEETAVDLASTDATYKIA